MTRQEAIWKGKFVRVTGIVSNSGKEHPNLYRLVGRGGVVMGEAKNGMLLVRFSPKTLRSIPAGCLTLHSELMEREANMTRMTKERKEELYEEYIAKQKEMERAEYLPKLLQVLNAACEVGYKLKIQNGEFQLREYGWSKPVALGDVYSRNNLMKLEEFEREVQMKQREVAEEARRAKVKQAALAKLTAEEREILGLK